MIRYQENPFGQDELEIECLVTVQCCYSRTGLLCRPAFRFAGTIAFAIRFFAAHQGTHAPRYLCFWVSFSLGPNKRARARRDKQEHNPVHVLLYPVYKNSDPPPPIPLVVRRAAWRDHNTRCYGKVGTAEPGLWKDDCETLIPGRPAEQTGRLGGTWTQTVGIPALFFCASIWGDGLHNLGSSDF